MRPKPEKRNSEADQAFIDQHGKEMRVVDGRLVWEGKPLLAGIPWQLPPEPERCFSQRIAKDDDGNPILNGELEPLQLRCPKWRVTGGPFCLEHSGGSNTVQKLVREQLLSSAAAAAARLADIALKTNDPGDALKAINSILDRVGIRPGVEIVTEVPAYQQILKEMFEAKNGEGQVPNAEEA